MPLGRALSHLSLPPLDWSQKYLVGSTIVLIRGPGGHCDFVKAAHLLRLPQRNPLC